MAPSWLALWAALSSKTDCVLSAVRDGFPSGSVILPAVSPSIEATDAGYLFPPATGCIVRAHAWPAASSLPLVSVDLTLHATAQQGYHVCYYAVTTIYVCNTLLRGYYAKRVVTTDALLRES